MCDKVRVMTKRETQLSVPSFGGRAKSGNLAEIHLDASYPDINWLGGNQAERGPETGRAVE